MNIDVAIIGGGPAGSAAALSLRQLVPDATIALFHKSVTSEWHPGEILAPGADPILRSLGCWDSFVAGRFPESFGTRACWGSPAAHENDFLFGMRGHGWRLDRARFDAMLREAAGDAGAEVRENAILLESEAGGDGWALRFRGFEHRARFVIDASGRNAVFAVHRGAQRAAGNSLAGVFVLFDSEEDRGDTLIEAAERGWWYSTSVPGGIVIAGFMTDTDLIRQFHLQHPECWNELLAGSALTSTRLHGSKAKGEPQVFAANSQRLSETGGAGWVAAGDAAMTFDPLSSQGIVKALRSGKLASFVAADFLLRGVDSHEKYRRSAEAEYEEYRKAKRDYYAMERRWAEATFWQRRR